MSASVYDFENEQQWLKGRMNGIGGSDASAVVGMNPYKSNIDLFEEKIGMKEEAARVPKTGKTADIIRAQCQCYFNFFDRIIGEGAHEEMFQGKISLNACLDAADELLKFENDEATKLNGRYSEYTIQQHGNRQQRRNYNKQHGKKQNKGNVTYYRNGNR